MMSAGGDDTANDVIIARIVRARGIRGEVSCDLETDFPQRFASLDTVTVRKADGSRINLNVESHRFHKGRVLLKFEGYDSMDRADELAGAYLVVPRSEAMPLQDGEFYEYDLVGSEVVTVAGDRVGQVARLMRTGGTDILVVEGEDETEYLIPFADEICTEVDVSAGRVTVDPPKGLFDL